MDFGIPYNSLVSSLLNAELRKNTHVIRTWDTRESVAILKHLSQKCEGGLPTGTTTIITAKRKRDAEPSLVFQRQLRCIPSMSENVTKKLIENFATIKELQEALANKAEFPKIMIDSKNSLGKTRIDTLCKYLL